MARGLEALPVSMSLCRDETKGKASIKEQSHSLDMGIERSHDMEDFPFCGRFLGNHFRFQDLISYVYILSF